MTLIAHIFSIVPFLCCYVPAACLAGTRDIEDGGQLEDVGRRCRNSMEEKDMGRDSREEKGRGE